MITQTFLTLVLGLTLAAPMAAQAPHGGGRMGGRPGMGPGPGFGMPMRGLDLTEAQKASMKAIAEKHREGMKPKVEAMAVARKALHQAMVDPATPAEQLKALHEKASQAQFELALNRRAMMQESMAILTPEQKAKAEKLRAEHPGGPKQGPRGMSHGRGMRPGGPGPETK